MPPNQSPASAAVGAGRWRSQRCHELVAPHLTFAARTVIAVAVHGRWPSAKTRRRLGFLLAA